MRNLYYLTFSKDKDWADKEGINDDLLVASLESLRRHSDAFIVMVHPADTRPIGPAAGKLQELGVYTWVIPHADWFSGRMLCRLEYLLKTIQCWSPDHIISSEADEFFLGDPFSFFSEDFDIGIGSRCPGAKIPVNAGLVFLRNNENVLRFLPWAFGQIRKPEWATYLRLKHRKNTFDVYCDRDLWWAVHEDGDYLKKQFGVNVVLLDAGYHMQERKCSFHLKSMSKKLIYSKQFKELMNEVANGKTIS